MTRRALVENWLCFHDKYLKNKPSWSYLYTKVISKHTHLPWVNINFTEAFDTKVKGLAITAYEFLAS